MRQFKWARLAPLFLTLATIACSGLPDFQRPPAAPTAAPRPSPTPIPAAEVVFSVLPPDGTPPDAALALVMLDEVTGFPYNQVEHPMERQPDGRWQAELTPAIGSLLRYRYVRKGGGRAEEISALGEPVRSRLAFINGATTIEDIVAAWAGAPYSGPTGRVVGLVRDRTSGAPLAEMLVGVGGLTTFTDGEGAFRIEGLPPGLHRVTVLSPSGAYLPSQQGALVAAESTTPAEMALQPAERVQATIELTVPEDTIPGTPVRMVGNIRQLGNVFGELAGGSSISANRAPVLVLVDSTHYLMILDLFAGTDLRYKYTLGDGLWNAEREPNGATPIRQIIVPDTDFVIRDTVATWRTADQGSVMFRVTVPEGTPSTETVSIQFNPFTWFEPLPMWRLSEREWFFVLHGPRNFESTLAYRYCRNLLCGGADDVETPGPDPVGRQAPPALVTQDLRDTVRAWRWWEAAPAPSSVVAPSIRPSDGFEVGVELASDYNPGWLPFVNEALDEIAGMGANAVTFSPTWTLGNAGDLPALTFDPARAPFMDELTESAAKADQLGLRPALRPGLGPQTGSSEQWWLSSTRDSGWWTTWFDEYRSFMLTYARAAEEIGAFKLIIRTSEVRPALPDGAFADGTPSGVPPDASDRWLQLIEEIRQVYSGRVALELEYGESLQELPPFLDELDEVHVSWHAPLGTSGESSIAEMQAAVATHLDDELLANPALFDARIILSVGYLSIDGGAMACPTGTGEECVPFSAFDLGAEVDPEHALDLIEQSEAVNAMLLEVVQRPEISGFYSQRFNPVLGLRDKSISVRGKPARDVLWYWYPRITGSLPE